MFPLTPYKIEDEWLHRGLLCVVTLTREAGHRCGYVRLLPNHPYWTTQEVIAETNNLADQLASMMLEEPFKAIGD